MKNSKIFNQLLNQPCWRIWRGGGATVFFELGNKLLNQEGEESTQGEFTIGLSSAQWSIQKQGKNFASDEDEYKVMDGKLSQLKDLVLQNIELEEEKEIIHFSQGIFITLTHPRPEAEWYVLTPTNEIIISGDGVSVEDAEKPLTK